MQRILLHGNLFFVKLKGNDNGTMDYIASEEDLDAGEEERVIFKKVPVEKGKEMKVQVEPGQDVTSQVLVKEDGVTIGYDSHLSVEELGKITLKTEVEGIGTASSVGNLTYGDAVVLSATTDGNNEFLGWYDKNGKLLSKEAEYPVIATEDKTYVAKFTDNYIEASDVLMPAKLNMKPGETKELGAEVVPGNATYPFLTYESSDTSVVSIDLFGNVTALKNGTATITATSVTEERTAACKVVVSESGEEISEPGETPNVAMPTPEVAVPQTPTNAGEPTAEPVIPTEPEKKTGGQVEEGLVKAVIRSVKVKKKNIVLTYKKVKGAKKYQIQVSRNKGFKKSKNYTTKKLAYVLKKLKKTNTILAKIVVIKEATCCLLLDEIIEA